MVKKQSHLNELFAEDIDYSMPINRFAKKACTLLNKMKRGTACGGEYGDGSARIYLNTSVSIELLVKFDKEVRKLARQNKELKKLNIPITEIVVRSYEINISFI